MSHVDQRTLALSLKCVRCLHPRGGDVAKHGGGLHLIGNGALLHVIVAEVPTVKPSVTGCASVRLVLRMPSLVVVAVSQA